MVKINFSDIRSKILDALDQRGLDTRKQLLVQLKHYIDTKIDKQNSLIEYAIKNAPEGIEKRILQKSLKLR